MQKLNSKGFGLIEVALVVVVLAIIGGGGAYLYHKDHKAKTPVSTVSDTSNKTSSQTSTESTSTSTTTTTDAYAGWQSYCDSTYHYCFKYPSGWTNNDGHLLSPSGTVQIGYVNPDTRDGGQFEFTPSYVGNLPKANQNVTVVGGYYTINGDYSPTYVIVDTSSLTNYPLTVGQQSEFEANAGFTDQATDSIGQLAVTPTASINSSADATAWLNSADAKTSLQILESFSYQQ